MARRPIPRALRGTRTGQSPERSKSTGKLEKAVAPRRSQTSASVEAPAKPTRGESSETRRPSPRPHPRPGGDQRSDSGRSRPSRSGRGGRSKAGVRRRRRVRNRWLPFQMVSGLTLVVLALIVVLMAAVAGGLGIWQRYDANSASARTAAVAAAAVQAQTLFSYDYRHLDRDIAASRKVITGKLATDFVQTSTKVVAPQATANKAVVQATVSGSSVVSAAPEKVTVLLFVNQAVQNKNIKGTRLDQYRVRITMQKVSGKWLISDATSL
jgi:Mce-associated membrane protein